ncbi:MAG TPA: 1-deoxy-D-xylulose-5-phosphate reductoisomerase [Clostridiaceae bacterium]|nr:1-deoxy-D-xylulose-5-phosphate reductoisomerase [Clostridiaceae bacterium]
MAKNIAILGSTGSIGKQTLEVARNLNIEVSGLTANTNIALLEEQAREFRPKMIAVGSEELACKLEKRLKGLGIQVVYGTEGISRVASIDSVDTVVSSIVGIAGLLPTLEAIKHGKNIALANKETLVTAGELVVKEAQEKGAKILPIDSEHSAVFQCIEGNRPNDVKSIILTASGGPFRGKSVDELEHVSVQEALKHPNWKMGKKITIDSATLMNKGLEVIEAKWLFGVSEDKIQVVIHPQSAIHSMVEYVDGVIIAQLAAPDMRIAIQYALTYPERLSNNFSRLDLLKVGEMTFESPDYKTFPCLKLAIEALKTGGTMPTVLNAVNEVAVSMFLEGKIGFMEIPRIIEEIMGRHKVNTRPSLDDIIEVDIWAREEVMSLKRNIRRYGLCRYY